MPNRIDTGQRFSLFTANKAEQQAFKRLYDRDVERWNKYREQLTLPTDPGTYRQFRKRILYDTLNGCYRIILDNIYIGIEQDGYTHS